MCCERCGECLVLGVEGGSGAWTGGKQRSADGQTRSSSALLVLGCLRRCWAGKWGGGGSREQQVDGSFARLADQRRVLARTPRLGGLEYAFVSGAMLIALSSRLMQRSSFRAVCAPPSARCRRRMRLRLESISVSQLHLTSEVEVAVRRSPQQMLREG